MATMFELIPAYKSVMDEMESNPEDADKWLDTLDSINCALEVKTDGYVRMIKMLNDTAGIKAESKRLADRAKAQENLANKLKERLQYAMELLDRKTIKTDLFTVTRQKTKSAVDIYDPSLLPTEFVETTITTSYDKNKIYKSIKDGNEVPGAVLMEKEGIVIR